MMLFGEPVKVVLFIYQFYQGFDKWRVNIVRLKLLYFYLAC